VEPVFFLLIGLQMSKLKLTEFEYLTDKDLSKLKEAGIETVEQLTDKFWDGNEGDNQKAMRSLQEFLGCSHKKADDLWEESNFIYEWG
jgi:hypothetical protein